LQDTDPVMLTRDPSSSPVPLARMARRAVTAVLLAGVLAAPGAGAASLADPGWDRLLHAGQTAALTDQARARLRQTPGDPQATLALTLAAVGALDEKLVKAALPDAERCVQAHPKDGLCHYALGQLMAVQALADGGLKAVSAIGRVKDELELAVQLAPEALQPKVALMQFYYGVPKLLGGSPDKGQRLAEQTAERQPDQGRLLNAMVAMGEEKWSRAQELFGDRPPSTDTAVRSAWLLGTSEVAFHYMKDGDDPQRARRIFEAMAAVAPEQALPVYGLARVAASVDDHTEAIRLFEQARTKAGAGGQPIDFREAMSRLEVGEREQATQLLERFVATGTGNPRTLRDANKKLDALRREG